MSVTAWCSRLLFPSRDIVRLGRWSHPPQRGAALRRARLAAADNCGVSMVPRGAPRPLPGAFDNSMDAAMCALQSVHGASRPTTASAEREVARTHGKPVVTHDSRSMS